MISDERTAGVCERIVAGFDRPVEVISAGAAHGQSLTLDDLVESELAGSGWRPATRRDAASTSSPPARPAGRSACRERTGSAPPRRTLYGEPRARPRGPIFSAIPLFHTYGMGASASSAAPISGATVVILEDPHPFLLKRHRALELIEAERVTVFPGRALQLPADGGGAGRGRPLLAAALLLRRHGAAALETFEAFGERFGVLVRQLYGSTETGIISRQPERRPGRDLRVGRDAAG